MRNNTIGRCLVRVRRIWRDLIFRAIVFFALALFAFSFSWNYADHIKENNAQQRPENGTEERVANYTLWLAIATFVLAASTIGLWVVTWRSGINQSRDTRRVLRITRASADAMKKTLQMRLRTLREVRRKLSSTLSMSPT